MTSITIPKDDEAAHAVASLATLHTWALAGYVASQVYLLDHQGRPTTEETAEKTRSGLFWPKEFADKGIRGLKSQETVRLYAQRWIDTGMPIPAPGDVVDVGDREWPPTENKSSNSPGKIAESPTSLATVLSKVTPEVLEETLSTNLSDEAFETLTEAVATATTPKKAKVTETGVTPAYKPTPSKTKAAEKAAEKVRENKIRQTVEDMKTKSAPKTTPPKPDGAETPAVEALKRLQAEDELWSTEFAIHGLQKVLEAVLNFPGPIEGENEEFLDERLGIMASLIEQIRTAIASTKGMVPDTVPESWN